MNKYVKGFFATLGSGAVLAYFALILAACAGWIMNIISLAHMASAGTFNVLFAVRVAGIVVAPLGAIMGWI